MVDGTTACPFVAFDDDRDARASSPDHRHRCFAELRPAPRALAHQDAYCLSTAFPVCPTFQDWARREAAKTVGAGEPTPPGPLPVATEAYRVSPPPGADRSDRNPPRDWAAPPPWLEPGRPGQPGVRPAGPPPASDPGPGPAPAGTQVPREATGLAGGVAARLMGGDPDADELDAVPAPRVSRPGPEPRPAPAGRPGAWRDDDDEGDDEEDWEDEAAEVAATPRRRVVPSPEPGRGPGPSRRREREDAPPWEESRRYEAYPSLRSRRLPGASTLLLGLIALILAAIALFFLPGLLGVGGKDEPTPSPSPVATVVATDTPTPTEEPAPTPIVYEVQAGDTMSRIAKQFGIPLQDLIDANKDTIPDPNALKIGDLVVIPYLPATPIPNAESTAP
jgi:LysM repeat protein